VFYFVNVLNLLVSDAIIFLGKEVFDNSVIFLGVAVCQESSFFLFIIIPEDLPIPNIFLILSICSPKVFLFYTSYSPS
ncbi:hypothetical protein CGP82_08670, partial [Campylobacter sp. LR185c]